MDGMEINGIDEGLNFDTEADDGFVLPPPLNESLLADDPVNIGGENEVNLQDNVDGGEAQDSAEKKKRKRAFQPRVNLNEQRLCSKKGIEALKNLCSDEVFKGKGHEVSDLNKLLYRFEHWAQCLMPRWPFDNVVQKCELLGNKSKVKNELKRMRLADEEVLRGEPEDDEGINEAEAETGQADERNEEDSVEVTTAQDVPREEERRPVEMTEEQRERIRQNRLLALERQRAKRKRLEEESQKQSQLDNNATNEGVQTNEGSSSAQPSFTNGTSIDLNPEETNEDETRLEHEIPNVFMTNDNQIDSMDDMNNDTDTWQSVEHCNGKSTNEDSSQRLNLNSEDEQEGNKDDSSDEDDEILNRSAFDLNPSSGQDASLSVDKNSELSTETDEQLQNQNKNNQNNENDMIIVENNETVTDINNSTSEKEHEDMSEVASIPNSENINEEDGNRMNIDNPTTG